MKAFYLSTFILFISLFSNGQIQNSNFDEGFGISTFGIREMDGWSAIHVDEVLGSLSSLGTGEGRSVTLKTKRNTLLHSLSPSTFVNDTIGGILTQKVDGEFAIPSSIQFDATYNIMPGDTGIFHVQFIDTNGMGNIDDALIAYAVVLFTGEEANWTLVQEAVQGDLNGMANRIIVNAVSSKGSLPLYGTPAAKLGSEISLDNIELNYATGISTIAPIEIVHCFPNPVKDVLTISYEGNDAALLHVISLQGTLVIEASLSGKNTQLNVSDLVPGVYLFQIKNSSNTIVAQNRFIKR